MSFLSVTEAAMALDIPVDALRQMCEMHLIEGAVRFGRIWTLPEVVCNKESFQIHREAVTDMVS